jgi:hypothetical protein
LLEKRKNEEGKTKKHAVTLTLYSFFDRRFSFLGLRLPQGYFAGGAAAGAGAGGGGGVTGIASPR